MNSEKAVDYVSDARQYDGREVLETYVLKEAKENFLTFMKLMFPRVENQPLLCPACFLEFVQHLQDMAYGKFLKLAASIPNQWFKTTTMCYWVAWLLLRRPAGRIIIATYAAELSNRASRIIRRIMENPLYKAMGDTRLDTMHSAVHHWETTAHGRVLFSSPGGACTGFDADTLLWADDLLPNLVAAESPTTQKNTAEWHTAIFTPRGSQNCLEVITNTRYGVKDIVGFYENSEAASEWKFFRVPAFNENGESNFPERYSTEVLNYRRKLLGDRLSRAVLDQDPIPISGDYVNVDMIKRTDEMPDGLHWVRSYDLAVTTHTQSDYTASVMVARDKHTDECYVASPWHAKMKWPDARSFIYHRVKNEPGVELVIEEAGQMRGLIDDLRYWVAPYTILNRSKPGNRDKLTRAIAAWIPLVDCGKIIFVERKGEEKYWSELRKQLASFPSPSCSDDYVDAITYAVAHIRKPAPGLIVY